ncbi:MULTISPECIES: DUF4158 domain-containing protein [Streptomyces]|uniref:DUF4158 domain-containing protein n=1 Tax=Streptomyces TaxID=1883 RepID=UPI00345B8D38
MTSIERTAYPRFKQLITARELHVFFTPGEEERVWAEGVTDSDEHQLALLVASKSYQRMGCFPKVHDVPSRVGPLLFRSQSSWSLVSVKCSTTASSPRSRPTGPAPFLGAVRRTRVRRRVAAGVPCAACTRSAQRGRCGLGSRTTGSRQSPSDSGPRPTRTGCSVARPGSPGNTTPQDPESSWTDKDQLGVQCSEQPVRSHWPPA